jgi:hypothetical protein
VLERRKNLGKRIRVRESFEWNLWYQCLIRCVIVWLLTSDLKVALVTHPFPPIMKN